MLGTWVFGSCVDGEEEELLERRRRRRRRRREGGLSDTVSFDGGWTWGCGKERGLNGREVTVEGSRCGSGRGRM